MWAKKIIAVSDMQSCEEDFFKRVEKLAKAKIDALILREKHLKEALYYDLAKEVLKICAKNKLICFLHYFDKVALKLQHPYFHCPLPILKKDPRIARYFHIIGTSIHSKLEFDEALALKTHYVIAGHIFQTPCKKDLEPKGVDFLNELIQIDKMPVYAIGGINLDTIKFLKDISINGVCLKDALMKCPKPKQYIEALKQALI